jgi:ATP-binding cassette subfamily B protein
MACVCRPPKRGEIASGSGANLRKAIRQVQNSFADIDRFSSASLITRMTNDINTLQLLVTMGLRMLTRAPVMLVAALAVAISINAGLAVVLLVVIPVMAVAIGVLMRITPRLFQSFSAGSTDSTAPSRRTSSPSGWSSLCARRA